MPDRMNDRADRWHSLNIALSKSYFFFQERLNTVDIAPHLSTNRIMDGCTFNFTNVTFNPAGDPPCPTPLTFSSYDYQNLSHQPFPPGFVQLAPQPLILPDSPYGHPMLDPALLSISNRQFVSCSPSPAVQLTASLHDVALASTTTGVHQSTTSLSSASSARHPVLDPALLSISNC